MLGGGGLWWRSISKSSINVHSIMLGNKNFISYYVAYTLINTPYSMVLQIIRVDILRVAWYFSEPRRGEEKSEQ